MDKKQCQKQINERKICGEKRNKNRDNMNTTEETGVQSKN